MKPYWYLGAVVVNAAAIALRFASFAAGTSTPWWAWVLTAVNGACLIYFVHAWRTNGSRKAAGDRDDSGASFFAGGTLASGTLSLAIDPASWRAFTAGTSTGVEKNEKAPAGLPRREGDLPIMAWKEARIVVGKRGLCFGGIGHTATRYDAVTKAECDRGNDLWSRMVRTSSLSSVYATSEPAPHDAPSETCSCGFYAVKERAEPTDRPYVTLEVELYGAVIVCERGYRAEKQRVIAMHLPECCSLCGQAPTQFVLPDGYGSEPGSELVPRCATHVGPFDVAYDVAAVESDLKVAFA